MDSESKDMIDFYEQALRDAAEFQLMVNFHGANKPTGEARTWPNEMTREGIRGLEYNKWSALPASHYASLPFARYLAGHGDFTVCTFRPDFLKGTRAGLQLATAVVLGEGLHFRLALDLLGPLDHDGLWAYDHPNRPSELLISKGHFNGSDYLDLDLAATGGFTARFIVRR